MDKSTETTRDPNFKTAGNLPAQRKREAAVFEDLRPEAVLEKGLAEIAGNSPQTRQLKAFQEMADAAHTDPPSGTAALIQLAETVPKNEKMKIKDIRLKLEALIREAEGRMEEFFMILNILKNSFLAIDNPKSVEPDKDLKIAAVEDYLKQLGARRQILLDRINSLLKRNPSEMETFDFGVDELEDILNAANFIASDKQLKQVEGWFAEGEVAHRKQGHKMKGATSPGITPEKANREAAELFLKKPAAPLIGVTWGSLIEKLGGYAGCSYQGIHDNKEKNLPAAKLVHKCTHLYELSIGIGKLSGGRAVVDIETGKVYLTEHYGQNIVKMILPLAMKAGRSQAEEQELHALFFLKKLINDFVLVTDIPQGIHDKMMKLACEAYLNLHLGFELFNLPPAGTACHLWCQSHFPLAILKSYKVDANPIAFSRWGLYCQGLPQLFAVPDGKPVDYKFGLDSSNPEVPCTHFHSVLQMLQTLPVQYGEVRLLTTQFHGGQNLFVCYVRAGAYADPKWVIFFKVYI